jgi:hypothetical protein
MATGVPLKIWSFIILKHNLSPENSDKSVLINLLEHMLKGEG